MWKLKNDDITRMLKIDKPMLFIDEAEINEKENTVYASFFLDKRMSWLKHHFIGKPVMPGTFMIEMLAQSAALLEMKLININKVPMIVALNKIRFLREVNPDRQLQAEVRIENVNKNFYTTIGKIRAEKKYICKAEMVHFVE